MSSSKHFNRTYRLTITGPGIDISVSKLDIRFDINFYTGARTGRGEITVIGLSAESIAKLEPFTIVSPGVLMSTKGLRVRLEAGYNGNNQLLIDGFLYSVSLSAPPELAISMVVIANKSVTEFEEKNITTDKDVTLGDFASAVFSLYGLKFSNKTNIDTNIKIGAKSIKGDLVDFMDIVQKMAEWFITYFSEDGVVMATPNPPTEVYSVISKDNGLLGVPMINCFSATICTWLHKDTPAISRLVELKSELHPSANGKYWVPRLRYKGEYRGKSWYTLYNGIRQGVKK